MPRIELLLLIFLKGEGNNLNPLSVWLTNNWPFSRKIFRLIFDFHFSWCWFFLLELCRWNAAEMIVPKKEGEKKIKEVSFDSLGLDSGTGVPCNHSSDRSPLLFIKLKITSTLSFGKWWSSDLSTPIIDWNTCDWAWCSSNFNHGNQISEFTKMKNLLLIIAVEIVLFARDWIGEFSEVFWPMHRAGGNQFGEKSVLCAYSWLVMIMHGCGIRMTLIDTFTRHFIKSEWLVVVVTYFLWSIDLTLQVVTSFSVDTVP